MLFLFFLLAGWQTSLPPLQARLELGQHDGLLAVTGHCRSLSAAPADYRYELSFYRETAAGSRSRNTQQGSFRLAPQQEVALSRSQVNVGAQDAYRIHLRVFDQAGYVVAQDSAIQNFTR